MPPRFNEILDSEDEDDLVAVKPPPLVATTPSGEDAPVDMDVDQSTASTEELLRRAQVALMAPTQEDVPVVNFSDLAATSVDTSPSSTNKKRPLLDTDPQPRSSGKLKRIKIVTKPESEDASADVYDVPHVPPFDGTSDTIPGPTLPSAAGHDLLNPTRTPKPGLRNSSQNQHSSSDQMNSLTPWSGTAVASSDKINSDDAIGLPKEMYIPRPSRSRSAQVENSHIDYALNVEKAAKKSRPKRSITDSADHSTSASIFPEHPIDQAPEFERLSPTPDAGHLKNSPQLASTVPESVQAPFSSAKSSKSGKKSTNTKQPGKRGRPRKNVIVDEEDELAQENVTSSTTKTPASAKTEVQVVIEPKSESSLAATVYAQLQQRSRESTTKPLDEQPPPEDISAQSQEANAETVKAEPLQADEESEDEIVKPRTNARTKAKAKSKAKSKTPEPVYKEDDESEHEVYDEYSQEVIKTKPKSKAKPKAKAKARGKAAKAVVEPDPPSDHDEDTPEQPLVDDHESAADQISEAEEDSAEEESPKPRSKAKTKAKPEPKSKATAKSEPVAPEPAAATPKPSPPIPQAETPKPAAVEVATSAAVVTPTVATIKKDAKSSTKPSWQQSTYRVGLSKTQRIPSLLKVFKK
ncbi:hypothetical protein KCU81_g6638, partial [Aureobasidium melanogenum]|uniref:Uncharacterized protein n=1 Tax=Aureobasidium melanogenum (strain CBS 110374) TaxID=1043003 RepID=A0A074VPM6_AURM1